MSIKGLSYMSSYLQQNILFSTLRLLITGKYDEYIYIHDKMTMNIAKLL